MCDVPMKENIPTQKLFLSSDFICKLIQDHVWLIMIQKS